MPTALRKTGISVVGAVPDGTHFCVFYETKEDLLDFWSPFFKPGWKTMNIVSGWFMTRSVWKQAAKALREVVSEFDRRLAVGDIEIVPHSLWNLKDGSFDLQGLINRWTKKINQLERKVAKA